jgi:hypothetical protein
MKSIVRRLPYTGQVFLERDELKAELTRYKTWVPPRTLLFAHSIFNRNQKAVRGESSKVPRKLFLPLISTKQASLSYSILLDNITENYLLGVRRGKI